MERMNRNQAGFTFIELLVASVMSLVILGLLAHIFRAQQRNFSTQTQLNTMQSSGRAATEFIARSVQNAGFNVKRGTRFLAASDHYLTAVYDANNDNVIQNDEIITYTIANPWDGSVNTDYSFVAHFDVNGDGTIQNTEKPTVNVQMTTAGGPPFNLYKVTPDSGGTSIERSLVARDIDNMVIRYYDKDGRLLPLKRDTDGDGVGDSPSGAANMDDDNDGVPDDANWNYVLPISELNEIRKVEIDILSRSHKAKVRGEHSTGTYPQGSLAALKSGSTNYNDPYHRETFTAQMSPRNLVMAPWGSVEISASPDTVDCPNTSTVTAKLLDVNGEPITGQPVNFTATGGTAISLGTTSINSDSNGEASTVVTYDFSAPYLTSTVSGSSLVDNGAGEFKPIYNATPIGFSFGGQGFLDRFDGTQTQPWAPLVPAGDEFQEDTTDLDFKSEKVGPGVHVGSVNGCSPWQSYTVQSNIKRLTQPAPGIINAGEHMGIVLRYVNQNNYYWVRIVETGGAPNKILRIGKTVASTESTVNEMSHYDPPFNLSPVVMPIDEIWTIKAQINGNEIKVKFWKPADPNDPSADEPFAWLMTTTDSSFTSGRFGVEATDNIYRFDNYSVANAESS